MSQRLRSGRLFRTLAALSLVLTLLSIFSAAAWAQSAPLITQRIDENTLVKLPGGLPVQLSQAQDLGAADDAESSGGLMLVLKRSATQEAAMQRFLQQVHEPSSPQFHKWLAKGQFAAQYGTAPSDIAQLTAWLQAQGLTVDKSVAGDMAIEFSGTLGQVDAAFHTSIHKYSLLGATHYANATAPQIPAAFSAVVAGISQLNDFRPQPQVKVMGRAVYNAQNHQGTPQWTLPQGGANPLLYLLAPEDFATQYDVKPVYASGVTGAGVTIGIINDSNIDVGLADDYRKLFGLPVNPPQVVIDGTDPGINTDSVEAYLDVENAGAVAPGATIKLYIAGGYGLLGGGGLSFSVARAVDDDSATVLSTSFGDCEAAGTAANQFWASAWAQAAAQGQTAFVSTGDSGSYDDCYGLGVNAIASTPWDVAVGGTDAYFSDYASGGASITNSWSDTDDANLGSLQKPFPEQPWNGTIFGLNSTTYDPPASEANNHTAGSGGASSCTVSTLDPTTFLPVCTAHYAKPSWQVGTGVPNDSARDLPDVSLFAANAVNGVAWPICAEAGDCTEDNAVNSQPYITAIGGTSASAPAMAAVMALIDQKYGPQGQADFTLYPLAAQFPNAFHDITVGSNNVPCFSFDVGFEIGCAADADGDGNDSLGGYSATAGYDLASGLGSVDVNNMLTDWGKISFKTSATTLSLSPTTLTHGATVTANVAVTGTGTPSGTVSLVTSSPLPNNKGLVSLQLGTDGTNSSTLNTLPGGTYTVTAQYSGDGINGASSSQPVSVTVNPEASTLSLTPQYYDPNTFQPEPIPTNSPVAYGNYFFFDVQVLGVSGNFDGTATGTVTFTDGTTTLAVVPVNSTGSAQYNGAALAPGSHTIGVSYSGDASYQSSKAPPFTFQIGQNQPSLLFFGDSSHGLSGNSITYNAGQNAEMTVLLQPNTVGAGALPTGTVTFQLGGNAPVTVPVVPNQGLSLFGNVSTAATVFADLAAGTQTLTATYSGDGNFSGSTLTTPILGLVSTLKNSMTTFTTTPSDLTNIAPDTVITTNITVTGSGTTAPTGTATVYLANLFKYTPVALTPGPGDTSTATLIFRAAALMPGNNSVTAGYSGDSVYNPSASGATIAYNDPTDFSVQATTPSLVIPSGSTGQATINLTSLNGFNGAVAISCSASQYISCTPSSSSITVNGATSTTVSINTVTPYTPTTTAATRQGGKGWLGQAGGGLFACVLLLVLPKRHCFGRTLFGVLAGLLFLGSAIGCGGSGSPGQSGPTTPANQSAAAGNYTVLLTGTSATGVVHNTVITVTVQ